MAAITKYAGLPDIDTATDIYETQDVPGISKNDSDSDDSLHRLDSITQKSRKAARGKAAGGADAGVADDAVDGSTLLPSKDRVRKVFGGRRERTRTRKGEETGEPITGSSSSASSEDSQEDEGDVNYLTARTASLRIKETPAARLRRLKWELQQLEKELEHAQAAENNQGTSGAGTGEIDNRSFNNVPGTDEKQRRDGRQRTKKAKPSTTDLLKRLSGLQGAAAGLDHAAASAASESIRNPTLDVVRMIVQKAQESGVVEQKDNGKEKEGVAASGQGIKGDADVGELGRDMVAAELDRRLHLLEKRIGTGTVDETSISQPIIQQLQKMESIVSLLIQPAYLDTAGRKVKLLLADLGKASALASSGPSSTTNRRTIGTQQLPPLRGQQPGETGRKLETATQDELERLDALYSLIPRIDPLLPVLPPLLTRLRSLASLHANASTFSQTLEQLESQTHEMAQREVDLGKMLGRVEEGLGRNAEGVERNWSSLEGRVDDLVDRLERLGVGK
ncbi:hypothetical protein QFC22_004807 [Naganishia vaughanmartiniae]|uniref:Uncharacterized protein n=1 Tax=Naganishia vaughanmartiniae TaxID=1424756 RepID=A0ACC2WZY2_9TREE|nr:hypothetical protein QFC22_004807 [Naganishia vaughanmartiniae]